MSANINGKGMPERDLAIAIDGCAFDRAKIALNEGANVLMKTGGVWPLARLAKAEGGGVSKVPGMAQKELIGALLELKDDAQERVSFTLRLWGAQESALTRGDWLIQALGRRKTKAALSLIDQGFEEDQAPGARSLLGVWCAILGAAKKHSHEEGEIARAVE